MISGLLKIFKVLVVLFLLFFSLSPKNIFADTNFETYVNVEYKVNEIGITSVTNTFTLVNKTSKFQADKYILSLKGIDPTNLKAYEKGNLLQVIRDKKEDTTFLTINFIDKIPGFGKTRTFLLTYDDEKIANKSGEIWEISIPKLENEQDFSKYQVQLIIPKSLGDEAYIHPLPTSLSEDDQVRKYIFEKDLLIEKGVSAGFGKSQVFNFNLSYHLENSGKWRQDYQIAIPPDTSLQRVFYESIDPKPLRVEIDDDGNWLALYNLKPKQRVDITAYGTVQIFATPRKISIPEDKVLIENTKESAFWQTTDPQIKELAKNLKTPKAIYDFVVSYLTYDNSRVKPDVTRLGAKSAIATPTSAICMEFTDLFIAIARAAGIPAREINGYAHTDNSEIKPLSLVADVLHAWPEYWSPENQTWIPIDPTWGATSGGDYFSKLDLRHFTFVIHGKNASYPYSPGSYKLGNNPQKDVFVTFGSLPIERTSDIKFSSKLSQGLTKRKLYITMKNLGSYAQYDLVPSIFFDDVWKKSESVSILPPFGEYKISIDVPYGVFANKAPNEILVKAGGKPFLVSAEKPSVIIFQLLVSVIFLFGISFLSLKKLKGRPR